MDIEDKIKKCIKNCLENTCHDVEYFKNENSEYVAKERLYQPKLESCFDISSIVSIVGHNVHELVKKEYYERNYTKT